MLKVFSCLLILWLGCDANQYTNPLAKPSPDPWIRYHNGHYHLIATTNSDVIRIRKAKTLGELSTAENQLVYTLEGHSMWAPEIHLIDDKWYLFYSSCAPDSGTVASVVDPNSCHRNHVAQSTTDDPMGPYEFLADLDDPEDEDFELDPSYIIINDKQYLLGSYNVDAVQHLYIRPMENPSTPTDHKHRISSPEYDWEKQEISILEGPEPLQHEGRTFVVYSASYCGSADYALGLLEFIGDDPLNSTHWHKYPEPVFKRSDENHVFGTGHNGFFKSPDGTEDWIVYHANDLADQGCGDERSSRAQKFTWSEDGLPVFGIPEVIGEAHEGPSGE